MDRDSELFSYVLDYLRNGGTLPPLPRDDPELVQRIRSEFDYFCMADALPTKTWVEKLRDHEYTTTLLYPDMLWGGYVEAKWRKFEEFVFSGDGEYAAFLVYTRDVLPTPEVWEAIDAGEDIETYMVYTQTLFGMAVEDGIGGGYALAGGKASSRYPRGLSAHDHELAFLADGRTVHIVDIRRRHPNNLVQTLTYSGDAGRWGFKETVLHGTHAVAHGYPGRVVVWDRATSQCVQSIDIPSLSHYYLLPDALPGPRLAVMEDGRCSVHDLSSPADSPPVLEILGNDRDFCRVSHEGLYCFQQAWCDVEKRHLILSFSVYSLDTGSKLRHVRLSRPSRSGFARFSPGLLVFLPYRYIGNPFDVVDLYTGEVTSMCVNVPEWSCAS